MKQEFYYKANEIYEKGIFELLEMGTQFCIKVDSNNYYCVVEEDSIFMYKNARGFESWIELIDQEEEISDLRALELEYMKYGLSLSFSGLEDLSKNEVKELKQLEIEYKDFSLIPRFRCHEELTLPFRIKENDFDAMNALLTTLSDIIENNFTLFDEEKIFFDDETDEAELDIEDTMRLAVISDDNKVTWDRIELPDEFDRYPSPSLNSREANSYSHSKSNGEEWDFHLFIVPNANENKSHLFPIAGVLFEADSRKILGYRLTRDYEEYCEDYLIEILDAIDDFGKPDVINVSSPRSQALIEKLCSQINIPVQLYSTFEDIDKIEVQLIKNFNY